jgi:hypothetical protein
MPNKTIVTITGTQIIQLSEQEIYLRKEEEKNFLESQPSELKIALDNLRAKRNKLLADTDYTVLQDSTFTDAQVAEWVVYRQALRDITNGITTKEQIDAIIWPTKPGA